MHTTVPPFHSHSPCTQPDPPASWDPRTQLGTTTSSRFAVQLLSLRIFVNAYLGPLWEQIAQPSSRKINQKSKGKCSSVIKDDIKLNKVPSPCTQKKTPGRGVQRKNNRFFVAKNARIFAEGWDKLAPQDPSLLVIETLLIIPVFQKQRIVVFYSSKGGCNMNQHDNMGSSEAGWRD